jgi:hypothetical protein
MTNYKECMKKRSGASFKGYVLAAYSDLVATFGLPSTDGDGDKIDAEWIIETPHGVATIYNYKNGKTHLGESGVAVERICEWHVGGKAVEPYQWIKKQISDKQIQRMT